LEEWSQYILAYINEYKEKYLNKQNEKLIHEMLENLTPLIISERDVIFDIKVPEEMTDEEKKDPEKINKEELMMTSLKKKGSIKNMLPKAKYRKLIGEEKTNFIKCTFFFFLL